MEIKSITLTGFKNFYKPRTFCFDKVNLITGKNGIGKSTLIKDSILFLFFGFSEVALSKLPTRNKTKECCVEGYIDDLKIVRKYPTDLKIFKVEYLADNKLVPLEFATSKTAQEWLNKRYKNIDYFRKFRMIDLKQGINILEEGKTSLRKTLFSFNESLFNNMRNNLMEKKREREIFNKDNLQLNSILYPSEKRLYQIEIGLLNLTEQMFNFEREYKILENDHLNFVRKKSGNESKKNIFKEQKNDIIQYSNCPICKREITESIKLHLIGKISNEIAELNKIINEANSKILESKENLDYFKNLIDKDLKRKTKLNRLQYKLENRLKLKKYKWTNKDIEIFKKSIKELDGFTSYCIIEWIKILEPIINDIIIKVGFTIKFDLDEKGDIVLKLIKNSREDKEDKEDKEEYNYKDLSSGQRLVISIAFQLALLMEKGESGLIIADEGFSSLDSENLQIVLNLFKNLPFQLLCVVHSLNDLPEEINVISL